MMIRNRTVTNMRKLFGKEREIQDWQKIETPP